ncbi:MAG: hypothetical protein ACXAEN_19430 [Candidatus Thorarchaeota archaeon]|jgi:transposase-like protein
MKSEDVVVTGGYFKTVRLKCPQCQTTFGKEEHLTTELVDEGKFIDVYCPICDELHMHAEAKVAIGEITRKHREYVRRQKITRLARPPRGTSDLN